jgi:hypothetical protein
MGSRRTSSLSQFLRTARDPAPGSPTPSTRQQCLEQILWAFFDIADRDDIHQAAARLGFVQQWIGASRAAADPVFADLRTVTVGHPRPKPSSQQQFFSRGVRA